MGKEGLMVVGQLKRLAALPPAGGSPRLEQFMRSHVSRLLRNDLLAVLAELLRQDHVLLSMKVQLPFPFLFRLCLPYYLLSFL
jgi:ribonuclease T2